MTSAAPSEKISAGLYIVATSIGNLGDMTLRAIEVLKRCDVVACEDTRVTGKLLKLLGISARLRRYDDHASDADREQLIAKMHEGSVALVSDAGMPLISDPGYRLVREARSAGVTITVVPGASAPLAALALSGLPNDRFLFAGFLPAKDKARSDILTELGKVPGTLIFFDTAPRLCKSLAAIAAELPGREVAVARELTKLHEECRTALPEELLTHYTAHPPKGEIVLLIGPPPERAADAEGTEEMLRELLITHKPAQAVAKVAKATGMDRKLLYALAMEMRGQ